MTDQPVTSHWPMYPGPAHPFEDVGTDRCGYGAEGGVLCGRTANDVTHRRPLCLVCDGRHWVNLEEHHR